MKNLMITLALASIPCLGKAQLEPLAYHQATIENSKPYLQGNANQKDLLLFLDMLKTTHAGFAKQIPDPMNLDSIQRTDYKRVKTMNRTDFAYHLQTIISKLHDGHSTVNWLENDGRIYPFQLYFDGKDYKLQEIDAEYVDQIGKTVQLINGQPIEEVIRLASPAVSGDIDRRIHYELIDCQALRTPAILQRAVPRPDSLCVFTMADGSEVKLQAKLQKDVDNEMVVIDKPKDLSRVPFHPTNQQPFSIAWDTKSGFGYLQFFACIDQWTMRKMYEMRGEKITPAIEERLKHFPNLQEKLKQLFTVMRDSNINKLIIDVRDNTGGNSILCDEILSYLAPIYNKVSYAKNYKRVYEAYRYSAFARNFYQKMNADEEEKIKQANGGKIDDDLLYGDDNKPFSFLKPAESNWNSEDSDIIALMNTDPNQVFKGKVYIIQNEGTFSSAGDFVMLAHDNHIGTIIGGPSTYATSCYSDLIPWLLPNTQIDGTISHGYFIRPDIKQIKDLEIIPEHIIRPTLDEVETGIDPCIEWIMTK